MTNKSGTIGTRTETAIVRHARANGFAGADEMTKAQRIRLQGAKDQGDIGLCPGVMIEAKGGHAAEDASDELIASWLVETEVERTHRGADVALLVTKRKGKGYVNAGRWWAHLPGWAFLYLADTATLEPQLHGDEWWFKFGGLPSVRLTLDGALQLLRRAGYGDPVTPSEADGARRNPILARPSDPPNHSDGLSGPQEATA